MRRCDLLLHLDKMLRMPAFCPFRLGSLPSSPVIMRSVNEGRNGGAVFKQHWKYKRPVRKKPYAKMWLAAGTSSMQRRLEINRFLFR